MKTKLLQIIRRKTVKQFIVFFTLAFVFLMFSKLSNDYRQEFQIQLQLSNIEEDIVLSNDSMAKVSAIVEAKGFSLLPYIFSNEIEIEFDSKKHVSVTKDAFVLDIAQHQYLFEEKFGESFTVRSLKPDSVVISYSKLASKKVPFQLFADIDFDIGYDLLGDFEFDVDSLTIIGADVAIDSITALRTEQLYLENINKDISEVVNIETSYLRKVEVVPNRVEVSGKVGRFTEGTIEVPVLITNKPENLVINVFPKTVSISFYVDLKSYNDILPSDFIVECEFPEDSRNVSYLIPKLTKKPEKVKRAAIKQKRIDFVIL